jgi:hypothetical protein
VLVRCSHASHNKSDSELETYGQHSNKLNRSKLREDFYPDNTLFAP